MFERRPKVRNPPTSESEGTKKSVKGRDCEDTRFGYSCVQGRNVCDQWYPADAFSKDDSAVRLEGKPAIRYCDDKLSAGSANASNFGGGAG
jgi:hypothetical protein